LLSGVSVIARSIVTFRAAALVAPLALAACDTQEDRTEQARSAPVTETEVESGMSYIVDRSHAGEAMPDAVFTLPGGGDTVLSDFIGKPTLVNLWATWCAPCIAEMPTLDALAEREGENAHVLTISQDMTGAEAVVPFFDKQGYKTLRPYLDPDNALASAFAVQTLPMTVIYGADGREVARVTGAMSWDGDRAAGLLDEADATQ